MGTPQKVREAKYHGDTAALSAMGRKGGLARARKRNERITIAEAAQLRRNEEAEAMIAERGGDPDD